MGGDLDATWKALAEPARRKIVALLLERPHTTGELCDTFEHLTRFGVMNHIGILKEAGLIETEKSGRQRINSLNPGPLQELYDSWMREYEVLWAGRLGRLKRHVESKGMAKDKKRSPWVGAPLASLYIKQTVEIAAPRHAVFEALTEGVGEWWGAPYLLDAETARDLVMEAHPGGRLREVTDAGDGYLWGIVDGFRRDRLLTLSGRMGMREAVAGHVRFELESVGEGTRLTLEHRAAGQLTEETEQGFSEGWNELLGQRLKSYLERGERPGIRGAG